MSMKNSGPPINWKKAIRDAWAKGKEITMSMYGYEVEVKSIEEFETYLKIELDSEALAKFLKNSNISICLDRHFPCTTMESILAAEKQQNDEMTLC